jgi:hypothetical protein
MPVYINVEDLRPPLERESKMDGPYIYTADGDHPKNVAVGLGEDLCKILDLKGITDRPRVGRPGEIPPTDGIIVHIRLLSWYGRFPREGVTDKVFDVLLSQPIFAEGFCRFSATLDVGGKVADLGIVEGKSIFQINRKATVSKEGNTASALAADKAIEQFVKSLESHFLN